MAEGNRTVKVLSDRILKGEYGSNSGVALYKQSYPGVFRMVPYIDLESLLEKDVAQEDYLVVICGSAIKLNDESSKKREWMYKGIGFMEYEPKGDARLFLLPSLMALQNIQARFKSAK